MECKFCDGGEVGTWGGIAKCESHVHMCCFGEVREEVEACKGIFYCVGFSVLEGKLVVV